MLDLASAMYFAHWFCSGDSVEEGGDANDGFRARASIASKGFELTRPDLNGLSVVSDTRAGHIY